MRCTYESVERTLTVYARALSFRSNALATPQEQAAFALAAVIELAARLGWAYDELAPEARAEIERAVKWVDGPDCRTVVP